MRLPILKYRSSWALHGIHGLYYDSRMTLSRKQQAQPNL